MKATITIGDLPREEHLDQNALLATRGGKTSDSYDPSSPYQPPVPDSDSGLIPFNQPYPARWNQYDYPHYKAGDPYSSAIPTSPGFLGV